MTPANGRLLLALPALQDPNFDRTAVLLVDHDVDGSLGIVLNRPSTLSLVEHAGEWLPAAAPPDRVFVGGPVQPDRGLALVWAADGMLGPDVRPIIDRVGLVNLDADPERVARQVTGLRVFAGYAGWGSGQLVAEIDEGAWAVVPAAPGDVVHPHPERLWADAWRRQPGRAALLARYPDDPRTN